MGADIVQPEHERTGGGLARSSLTILLVLLAGRAAAFVKEIVVAAWFGNGAATDAFYLGWLLPAIAANLLGASVESALIPRLVRLGPDSPAGRRLYRTVAFRTMALTVPIAVLLGVFAEPLAELLGGADRQATAGVLRMMTLYIPAQVWIFLVSARLAAMRRFGWTAAWLIASSAGTLACLFAADAAVVWFRGDAHDPDRSAFRLAQAVLAGYGFAAVVISLADFRFWTNRDGPPSPEDGAERRAVFADALLLAAVGALPQATWLFDLALAGRLDEGAASALQRAALLSGTLLMLTARSVAKPSLVALSEPELAPPPLPQGEGRNAESLPRPLPQGEGGNAGLSARLVDVLCPLIFWMLPAAVLTGVLAEPLVRLMFQRGEWDPAATAATAAALQGLAAGLVFSAASMMVATAFTAAGRTGRLLVVQAVAAAAHVPLTLAMVAYWPAAGSGSAAIAWSVGLTAVLTAAAGLRTLAASGGPPGWGRVSACLLRGALGAAASAGAAAAVFSLTEGAAAEWVRIGAAAGAGIVAYLAAAALTGSPEFATVVRRRGR